MRLSRYSLLTLKETPADAEVVSHRLMLRAGLIQNLASGLYSWLPLGMRVLLKVTDIVREEMDRAGALEVLMPAIQPAQLWQESGRWQQYGPELLRLSDRHHRDFCFGPTHEEVITDIVRGKLKSYRQLPVNFYQIQTKFRDEIRPRFGVMRAREFVMKDAYSFHMDQECLEREFDQMRQTYCRIFDRLGLQYRYVQADSGTIGGAVSYEFHVLAEHGEDEIVYSDSSDYSANVEQAPSPAPPPRPKPQQPLEKVDTPGQRTIQDVRTFLKLPVERTVKTLIVAGTEDPLVALVLRGDHRLNAIKAARLDAVQSPLRMVAEEEVRQLLGCGFGSLGPVGLDIPIIVDAAAAAVADFACGANTEDMHYTGTNWDRDAKATEIADLRNLEEGEPSPDGAGTVHTACGIEVGHIFQLGTKYSESMECTVLDSEGQAQTPFMGCYGIGVTRIVAAAIEQNHDEHGIIWPDAIAPYSVILTPIGMDREEVVREAAESLYRQCQKRGIEVVLDDRNLRPGVMFSEAELIGIPHRVTIGARSLAEGGMLEYRHRRATEPEFMPAADMADFLAERIATTSP